ncbi:MAG: Crp/Fnr family transcriptional regulator [Saprospiraceae bacterium]
MEKSIIERQVQEIIASFEELSSRHLQLIFSNLQLIQLEKAITFIKKGKPDSFEYFLLEGVVRSYVINPDGEEITLSLFQGPDVISPHSTRTASNQSLINYQTLTEVHLAAIDAEIFVQLMIDHLPIRDFGNGVLRKELMNKIKREIYLASVPAKERLLQLRNDFAGLENMIPHPIIASYLGITNISLSRLRKELST